MRDIPTISGKKEEIILQVEKGSLKKRITCERGRNLLEVLQKNGFDVAVYCGGNGTCGKCGVLVTQGNLPITTEDIVFFSKERLAEGMRLSCKAILQENLTISIEHQHTSDYAIVGKTGKEYMEINTRNAYRERDYGIAIDIGTTTLASSLIDLHSGKIIDTYTAMNSQREFGADVISRIQASNEGKKEQLSQCIKEDIFSGIVKLIGKNFKGTISHIAIAANTVMFHLLSGYSCKGLSRYPFSPQTLKMEELTVQDLFDNLTDLSVCNMIPKDTRITLLPGISAFVGADITAGLYACDIYGSEKTTLFIDLGTNGEIVLKGKNKIYVTSTAAGPAFEGGNIKWGVGSIPGAISQVTIKSGKPEIKTIKDQSPQGICGTGVIEAVAELYEAGLLDETGKLAEPYFKEGYPLAKNEQGEIISLTQQDVREIQLAKAAIRAGIEILFSHAKIACEDVQEVYFAGGFGYFLNIEKAVAIGILPKELAAKSKAVGNTSLEGALKYLAESDKNALQIIVESAKEIVLAEEEKFQELYLEYMMF